ncbi:MAG: hypothetical protein IAE91_10115 [Ignavibacteriaceae bacterium]|nr:hypothetical protein [Ignavibacteriaceae bacterium]
MEEGKIENPVEINLTKSEGNQLLTNKGINNEIAKEANSVQINESVSKEIRTLTEKLDAALTELSNIKSIIPKKEEERIVEKSTAKEGTTNPNSKTENSESTIAQKTKETAKEIEEVKELVSKMTGGTENPGEIIKEWALSLTHQDLAIYSDNPDAIVRESVNYYKAKQYDNMLKNGIEPVKKESTGINNPDLISSLIKEAGI